MNEFDPTPDPDERTDTAASSERPRTDGRAPAREALAGTDARTVSRRDGRRSGGER